MVQDIEKTILVEEGWTCRVQEKSSSNTVLWLHVALCFLAAYHVIATCKSRKREAEASGSVRGHWVLTVVRRGRRTASGPRVDRAKLCPPSGEW